MLKVQQILIFFGLSCFLINGINGFFLNNEASQYCYGKVCPYGTAGCSASRVTSGDRLITKIYCLDRYRNVIYAHVGVGQNPLGKNGYFFSKKFEGTFDMF